MNNFKQIGRTNILKSKYGRKVDDDCAAQYEKSKMACKKNECRNCGSNSSMRHHIKIIPITDKHTKSSDINNKLNHIAVGLLNVVNVAVANAANFLTASLSKNNRYKKFIVNNKALPI